MRSVMAFAILLAFPPAVSASPQVVSIELSNFRFAPNDVRLQANVPVVLHLSNAAGGGHNFSAPEFFAAARLDPQSAALVRKGRVEVPSRGAVDISLVPAEGKFSLKCTHTLHSSLGMKGTITVQR